MRIFIAIGAAVLVCLGLSGQSVNAQQNFAATQAILSYGLHLFVPVSVNGTKRTWWLVDTGAPLSLISPVWQQKLSLPTPATGSEVSATARSLGKDYPIVFAQSVDFNGAELGPGYFVVEQIS